jgi:hypothetical protein
MRGPKKRVSGRSATKMLLNLRILSPQALTFRIRASFCCREKQISFANVLENWRHMMR